jgi:glycosyltransferase involved in cell wall biosynthesis
VACVSEEVVIEVLRLGVDERKVIVSAMAVDASEFTPSVSGVEIRQRLGLPDSAFVVGWTGSFRGFHGLENALDAFVVLQRSAPESRLVLVGDGSQRADIEARARALGVGDAVVCPGAVAHQELPAYVAAMDATIVTAKVGQPFHYSPQKMREYLAAGRPVVAPRIGDIARTLTDGVDGLLYETGDAQEFGARLLEVRDDPALRARLGRAGRDLMERTGTWDVRLADLLSSDAFQRAVRPPTSG